MDMKEVMERVRADLQERPGSHFSDIYFRVAEHHEISSTALHNALYQMLKKDEISTGGGKWTLLEERRKAS